MLDAASVQMAPDGYRRIVWMIIGMIKAHPTDNRKARQAPRSATLYPASIPSSQTFCLVMATGRTSGSTAARTGGPR
jgi:hypothetical protein